jgi:CheY-like chemotaxis protein
VAKILVADDNSNIQKMVGLALKDQGIDVVAVGNGEAAVRKISDIHPDLVLADVFMPVRNGYEVCRYVKEDPSLAHTPVILLVGAFDPLDEQEAQRVGADGVLKKPFVPPDPLIAMVKSALTRAGVSFGAAAEKPAVAPSSPSTAEILHSGMSSKLAAFTAEKIPEVAPEPIEELPTPTPQFKIAAGSGPLAFGSLLDTSDADDLAVTAKPMIDLSSKKWEEDSDGVEEEKEEEEEQPRSTWRPGGIDEVAEEPAQPSQASSDWRDQAFHGDSPAKSFSSNHWSHSLEQPAHAEAPEHESIAVATVLPKPPESPAPFSSDAWAAAMASGVEGKIAELRHAQPEKLAPETAPEVHAEPVQPSSDLTTPVQDFVAAPAVPAVEPAVPEPPAEPANWAAVPETTWEVEAKKAALLASTWDAPKALGPDDTQEIPAYSCEPHIEHGEPAIEAPAEVSHYSAEPMEQELPEHAKAEPEPEPQEPVASQSFESTEPKSWENASEAPAVVPPQPAEPVPQEQQPVMESARVADEPATPEPALAQPPQVNMDELVDKVLGKMNPDVLQKVTHEILRPLIEAIVRAELESKKP